MAIDELDQPTTSTISTKSWTCLGKSSIAGSSTLLHFRRSQTRCVGLAPKGLPWLTYQVTSPRVKDLDSEIEKASVEIVEHETKLVRTLVRGRYLKYLADRDGIEDARDDCLICMGGSDDEFGIFLDCGHFFCEVSCSRVPSISCAVTYKLMVIVLFQSIPRIGAWKTLPSMPDNQQVFLPHNSSS